MKILKSICKISLTGLTFTYLASANMALAFGSFELFSKEEEVVVAAAEIPQSETTSSMPEFLSETFISGIYSDGCATFETREYIANAEDTFQAADFAEINSDIDGFNTFSDEKHIASVAAVASVIVQEPAEAPTQKETETFSVAYNSFGGGTKMSDDSLSETRGASLQVVGETIGAAILTANAVGNNSNNSVTGSNTVNGDAFGSASGVVSLIQNSGNNVIIQSATVVNLKLQ